jgi:hypothetical protein
MAGKVVDQRVRIHEDCRAGGKVREDQDSSGGGG